MRPKVTISVAIYNVAPYIEQCVRSLYEQTLEDLEILLVDDCTPDDSIDIALKALEDYPNRKDQVRVFRHEHNMGIAATKTDCFQKSTGEYVIIVDGDDFVDSHYAELLYNRAIEKDADLVFCGYYRYQENECKASHLIHTEIQGDGEKEKDDIINRKILPFLVCRLVRRTIFEGNDIIWPVKNMGEDTLLSAEFAYYAKRLAKVDEHLYYYRYNPNSVTKLLDEDHCLRNLDSFKSNVELLEQFLTREGVADKYWYGIFINKMRTKNRLLRITGKIKYRKMWLNTFPEINKTAFWGDSRFKSDYRAKVWFIVVLLGLYPIFRKQMHTRRFRPSYEWV